MSLERDNLEMDNQRIEELVLMAQDGDMDAFAQLYDLFVNRIYKYIYFKVESSEAADLTETVFLRVWEKIRSYKKRSGATFKSWVFRIAHNLVVDHHRFKKESVDLQAVEPWLSDGKRDSDPRQVAEQSLSSEVVRSALKRLKKNYREVLTLHYLNDLGNNEVAEVMGKSEGSLRVLKFRALQEMKKVLAEMGYDWRNL